MVSSSVTTPRRVRWSTCTVVLHTVEADASKLPSDGVGVGLGVAFDVFERLIDDFESQRESERAAVAVRLTATRRREIASRGNAAADVNGLERENAERRVEVASEGRWTAMSAAELDALETENAALLQEISSVGGGAVWGDAAERPARYSTAAPGDARDGAGGGFCERDDALEGERRERVAEERARKAARRARGEKCPRCHRASCIC